MTVWRTIDVCLVALLLSGCGLRPERLDIQRVDVPVMVPCIGGNVGPAPAYPDSDEALKAAPEGPVRYQMVAEGRAMRDRRLAELEAVARNCP